MLDSLETEDSVSALPGMLRTRLEVLLENNSVEFDWQITDEPKLKQPGPSRNLSLLRIMQEAIPNVIKQLLTLPPEYITAKARKSLSLHRD